MPAATIMRSLADAKRIEVPGNDSTTVRGAVFMPELDLIRNGMVADGSGLAGYPADVGVKDGRITAGRLGGSARQALDAEGKVLTPDFIDGHTHMDAQLFWAFRFTQRSIGITATVVGGEVVFAESEHTGVLPGRLLRAH